MRALARQRARVRLAWYGRFGHLPQPQRWVFIVGCYNSGTTLLHDMLARHASIGSLPNEGQFLTDQLPLPRALGLARLWALQPEAFWLGRDAVTAIDVQRLKRHWGAQFNDARRPILLEKSPTNAARVLWLEKHFANACFIGIVRNGFAVAEGIARKARHSIDKAARQWRVSNEIMLRDFEELNHKLIIRYEDLVAAPEQTIASVSRFLGIDAVELLPGERQWQIHGDRASIQNMNERSVAGLLPADRQLIVSEAGALLERLGYALQANDLLPGSA